MTVYDDYAVREQVIWAPFINSFRFSDSQDQERVLIFGLYSGTYLNNKAYLETIDAFELALIVDDYNQKIAGLTADEQNLLVDLASQRYIKDIDRQILYGELALERTKIAAENDEWTAKISALASDYKAIETIQTRLESKQKNVSARIDELRAAISKENVNYQFAIAEVEEKEMAVGKANVQLTLKDAQESRKDAEITSLETDEIKKDVEYSNKELEISQAELQILQTELQESETELQIINTNLDVSKIQLQVVGAGIKSLQYQKEAADIQIRNAGIEADIAKTAQIQVNLANAQIENTEAEISNAEKDLRVARINEEIERTELRERQANIDFLDVDRQAANAKLEAARIEEKMAETEILEAESEAETARYNGEVDSLGLYDSKKRIIESETNLLEEKTANAEAELDNIETIHNAEMDVVNARHHERIEDAEFSHDARNADYNEKVRSAENELEIVQASRAPQESITTAEKETIEAREERSEDQYDAQLTKIRRILSANLITNLRHSIDAE